MIIKTDAKLIFDTADENCKFVIANERATVVCINGKSKKKSYQEYWISLADSVHEPLNFDLILREHGLEKAIMLVMDRGQSSNIYIQLINRGK